MIPMGSQKDDWIAAAALVRPHELRQHGVGRDAGRRRARARRQRGPQDELDRGRNPALPARADPDASRPGRRRRAPTAMRRRVRLSVAGWTSGAPQSAGMWFQLELPDPVVVSEMQFDAGNTAPAAVAPVRARCGAPGAGRPAAATPSAPTAATTAAPGTRRPAAPAERTRVAGCRPAAAAPALGPRRRARWRSARHLRIRPAIPGPAVHRWAHVECASGERRRQSAHYRRRSRPSGQDSFASHKRARCPHRRGRSSTSSCSARRRLRRDSDPKDRAPS